MFLYYIIDLHTHECIGSIALYEKVFIDLKVYTINDAGQRIDRKVLLKPQIVPMRLLR